MKSVDIKNSKTKRNEDGSSFGQRERMVIRRHAYMKDYYTRNKDEWTKRRNENRDKVNRAKREYYWKNRNKILLYKDDTNEN